MGSLPKKFLAPARFLTVTNIVTEIVLCYENLPKQYYGKKAKTLTNKNIMNKLTVGFCNKLTKHYFAYQEPEVDMDDTTLENMIVKFLLKNDFIYNIKIVTNNCISYRNYTYLCIVKQINT